VCRNDVVVVTGTRAGGRLLVECQVRSPSLVSGPSWIRGLTIGWQGLSGEIPARNAVLVTSSNHGLLVGRVCVARISYSAESDDELSFLTVRTALVCVCV
jgi:hypothetical protein